MSTTSVSVDVGHDGRGERRGPRRGGPGRRPTAGVDLTDTGAVAPRDVLLAALLTTPAQEGVGLRSRPSTATAGLEVLPAADLIEIDTEGFELADLVVVVSGP